MRDDFINYIKENLAKRVGMRCSNPNCRQLTNGPSSDPKKSVNIGVAAHIAAASPGGKRYDSQQTSAQRSAISNGIWLCQNCAKLIDSDEKRFQIEVLHKWKLISEEAARYDVENKTLDEIKHIINNINITSVNQSGGQVAHTIINQKAQRRSIPTDIQTAIANRLKNFPPEKFTIRLSSGDPEADNISRQIKSILLQANWSEVAFEYNLAGSYPEGIEIAVPESISAAQQELANLIHGANLNVTGNKYKEATHSIIIVGPNPMNYIS